MHPSLSHLILCFLCYLFMLHFAFPDTAISATNDIGCVLHSKQPSAVFVSGEPMSIRLEFENRGTSALFFQHPGDVIVNGFHIASRNSDKAIPLTAFGKQWDLLSLIRSSSRNSLSLDSGRTMTWDCPVALFFDLSLPGDYSLDIDIPMRKTTKAEESVSHIVLSNIVFHINEPTNTIVTFPKP